MLKKIWESFIIFLAKYFYWWIEMQDSHKKMKRNIWEIENTLLYLLGKRI